MNRAGRIDGWRIGIFVGALVLLTAVVVGVGVGTDLHVLELLPIYIFTPAIAALVVMHWGALTRANLGIRLGRAPWFVIAAIGGLVLPVIGVGLAVLMPSIELLPHPDLLPRIPVSGPVATALVFGGYAVVTGASIGAVWAAGEELGWRGYLLWELAPLGFWPASLLIGIGWGVWHAPLIISGHAYPAFPVFGVGMMIIACISSAPLYTYVVVESRSVIAAVLLHGVFVASGVSIVNYTRVEGPLFDQLVASPYGLAGAGAFVLATALMIATGVPELSRERLVST